MTSGRWVWLARLALVALAAWPALSAPWDRWWLASAMRARSAAAPPVSSRIAHFDIGRDDLDGWPETLDEYNGIASIVHELRAQGADVIVIDLLLKRGREQDFAKLWRETIGHDDVVMARTWLEHSNFPRGSKPPSEGLVYVDVDSGGLMGLYSLAREENGDGAPSLALATYLKLTRQSWSPDLFQHGEIRLKEVAPNGDELSRRIPAKIRVDERSDIITNTTRNVYHLNTTTLRDWSHEPDQPHLAGKAVFIGYVAPGAGDLGKTALSPIIPKVALHALALNDLIQDSWRVRAPGWLTALLAALLAATAALAGELRGARVLLAWALGVVGLSYAGSAFLAHSHWIVPIATLMLMWTLALGTEKWRSVHRHQARSAAMVASAAMDDPMVLKTVGHYQISRRLGSGGFASVYLGLDVDTLDPEGGVAIKVVHPALAESPDFARRFLREIRISAQLVHPNIVRVLDSGNQNGLLYLVMELAQGRPLRRALEAMSPAWNVGQALRVLRPMMEAIDYAHGIGVVHRDLKPENVMVTDDLDVVKVLDFGLAFDSDSSRLTTTGELLGSVAYLAPERITGSANDPRSDQYAIGVMAYEMLAGRSPFEHSTTAEALLFRLTRDPEPLATRRPDLPPALLAAVGRMMHRDPSARFESVAEALGAIAGPP